MNPFNAELEVVLAISIVDGLILWPILENLRRVLGIFLCSYEIVVRSFSGATECHSRFRLSAVRSPRRCGVESRLLWCGPKMVHGRSGKCVSPAMIVLG